VEHDRGALAALAQDGLARRGATQQSFAGRARRTSDIIATMIALDDGRQAQARRWRARRESLSGLARVRGGAPDRDQLAEAAC